MIMVMMMKILIIIVTIIIIIIIIIIMIIINSIFQPAGFSAGSTTESINIIKKGSILNHMK